ncbi:glycosyltransferase [Ornithinimicrobium cerasi]|uniref:glycosyltransferase n=1 Tax=Ornithinimicrobium cerasi TaxID=2248773 RepID=UPI0011431507|nr:glycosyltransferase [Ornithinimicrobium cerasi]
MSRVVAEGAPPGPTGVPGDPRAAAPSTPVPRQPAVGSARPDRARVEDVTVVLLTGPGGLPVQDLLSALARQHPRPRRVLVTGLDPHGDEFATVLSHPLRTDDRVPLILRPPLERRAGEDDHAGPATWRVLEDARTALPVHPGHWLWVLRDDSLPEPGALAALASAVRRTSRVAVIGPKLVRLDDPRLLLGVGHHLTAAGRVADPRQAALVDQGQLDLRQDVLGVPLAGSLVRSDVLDAIGGLDPAFGADGVEGLDLGWRTHLTGHRVVVAPDAVVRQGDGGLGVVHPRRTRVRQRQVALARGPALASLWRALGVAFTSLLAAVVLLLVKRPSEAADELADVRGALSPGRGWGARWRFRRRRTVRPRDLSSLFLPRAVGWRTTLDTLGEALDPRARGAVDEAAPGRGRAGETGPVNEDLVDLGADGAAPSRWSWPLATALVVASALTAWRWAGAGLLRALLPAAEGVSGGELGPAPTGSVGLWRSALDGWRGGGLGHSQPAEAWLVPASALARVVEALPGGAVGTSTAGVALGWVLLLAVPASVLTAHLALRRATHRRWVRAALALGWAGLAPLGAATAEGRVGPVVVHVLAPLLVAGYAVAATPTRSVRRTAATFATVLLTVLLAHWVPVTLVLTTLAGLLLLVLGTRAVRARGAVLALLPWVLLLPWLPGWWSEPVRVLGGAGATSSSATHPGLTPPWQLLLLGPGQPVDPGSWAALPLWCAVPVWLAALAALALPGRAGHRAGVLMTGAVLALTLALLAPRLALGELAAGYADAGRTVTAWPGTMLSLAGAALLLAAALLVDAVLAHPGGSRSVRGTVTAAVAGAGVVALLWVTLVGGLGSLGPAPEVLPAVAAEQARGPSAQRTLVLEPSGPDAAASPPAAGAAYRVTADLVGVEPEPARILRDRARDLVVGAPAAGEVPAAVTALTGQGTPQEASERLGRLGVGYVQLGAPDADPVASLVDRVPGLTRVSSPAGQVLWRVAEPPVARVAVRASDGELLERIPVTGPHGASSGSVDPVPEGARLEVAEGEGWFRHATVLADGVPTRADASGTVVLPAGTRDIEVGLRTPGLPWHLVALVLVVVTAFLALPFGRTETSREQDVQPRAGHDPAPGPEEAE